MKLSYYKMNLKIKILLSFSYVIFLMIVTFAITACSDSFTDDRDGQSYDMVQIGDQIWMAENLNYAGVADAGAANPNAGATALASFCPDGDDRNCKKYGRLYTWKAAQIACPAGWRLPTREDFEKLVATAGEKSGRALKSTSGWFKKGDGDDSFGFRALPAGYMTAKSSSESSVGKFDGIGGYAHIWSATVDPQESFFAQYLYLDFSSSVARLSSFSATDARSVRCVKN